MLGQGGRCIRFLSEGDRIFDYIHKVEYYCWPYSSEEKRQPPFHILATQSIPKRTKNALPSPFEFTDLDNELIKPVLDSLKFYPLPDKALQIVADDFAQMCDEYRDIFLNKKENRISDYPDQRRIILVMRDCGYDVSDPIISVNHYDEIFEKNRNDKFGETRSPEGYQLIEVLYSHEKISFDEFVRRRELGRYYYGTAWFVYKVSREKFARIEQKLLALNVLKETEPVTRYFPDYTQKPSFLGGRPPYNHQVTYESWYYIPPGYKRITRRPQYRGFNRPPMINYPDGFGFRYDEERNARVMDINFDSNGSSNGITEGYALITLVEGD